jgi:hypothetical protein
MEGRRAVNDVTCFQQYDREENILYVTFPRVHLETQAEIEAHFDRVLAYWRDTCNERKVFYVVGFDGFTVNLRENDFYAAQMKRVLDECAITVVRYGGDSLQRTAIRLYNLKLHAPSRLYESKEEAVEVVRAIQAGSVQVEAAR